MARNTTQGPEMRLPVRPAPAPPKANVNNNYSKGGRPPLQRRITNVGLDWVDPWNERENNESAICHSLSAMQLSNSQEEPHKKKTPPPRPPPPRFSQTGRNQQSRANSRNNYHKSGSSGLLSALFNPRRPNRKPQHESGNRHYANGRPHRGSEKHNQDTIVWETCNQKQRQSGNKPNHTGVNKKSSPVNNGFSSTGLRETRIKTESPPPLLDLLTSSPPSSPVPSSRFGGSTGADTDSLSSDGFSKMSAGNSFPAAFSMDDDPFDPFDNFGERLNGGASSGDPWAGEDPFSPSPAPRSINSADTFDSHWSSGTRNNQFGIFSQNPVSAVKENSSTMVSSSSFTFGEQEDWPLPAVRSTTSSPIGNIDLLSSLDVPSSDRNETRSVSNPNIRNLSSTNGGNQARPTIQSEVPRTMNLAILGAMPTIIRAKPKPKERNKVEVTIAAEEVVGSSPPMPSVPPPPPPPTMLLDDLDSTVEAEYPPDLPPRPWKQDEVGPEGSSSGFTAKTRDKPHGIALFDYPATHTDDLPFQTGDVILLIRKINDDWYYGQREAGGNPGMFPSTFIRPVIDLPGDNEELDRETDSEAAGMTWSHNPVGDRNVRALYSFKPEVAEDLEFEEGDIIEVTGQLDSEWLWGRLGSKLGQFPASFVDHVPRGLPQHCP